MKCINKCKTMAAVHLALQTLQSICSTDMTGPFDASERSNSDYVINTLSFLLPLRSNCLTSGDGLAEAFITTLKRSNCSIR